ncbi:kinesin light chain [Fusarium austroafricanum]|uniref:Kinesin light chain n=1 Tax=Fusarium austroafricanum TaxID=2364996 RepID=A0A8H4KY58_9HYPO|nr:kinesin light chain [Fusarium austroafricanum]
MPATQRSHSGRRVILDPKDYKVAWIAPLEIEAKAALCLLDERHRGRFPVDRGDDYVFHAGAMDGHNIIIATLPAGQEYGTGSAAALASQVKKFFPNLWFGLLVGVAAGLPDLSRVPIRDIRLGDVLVGLPDSESAGLVPYDLGKETEDGFQPLRLGHSLAMTEPIVRSAIGSIKLQAPNETEIFLPYYEKIRNCEHATGTFADPGQNNDILYLARDNGQEEIVERPRRSTYQRTRVWYGPIGSGDKLLKNAQKRNELRDRYGIIGLEMEAAGTMNRIPVGVIRGVCDYGDQHKNKDWQPYAAAMAASYARALLDEIPPNDTRRVLTLPHVADSDLGPAAKRRKVARGAMDLAEEGYEPCYYIPFTRNPRFTGRAAILNALDDKFFGPDQSQKVALVGLGGVGKTQIALHFAYQIKEKRPDYSIFWVPILSDETAERAYVDIAKKLRLQKNSEDDDVKDLVCQHLCSNKAGKWLFIVDNADDQELLLGSAEKSGLEEYLPHSEDGIVLLTTRSRHVAVEFAQSDVIDTEQMDQEEATTLLEKSLVQKQLLQNEVAVVELLTYLTFLPLAITQAAAYLNQTRAPIRTYLGLLRNDEDNDTGVLDREFRDNTRYKGSQNAVGTTWIVSFRQIQKTNQLAVDLLSFMSCIEPKAIPQSILPDAEADELEWAIGTLCSYSFLVRREETNVFDMHSLVHTATRGWLEKQNQERRVSNDVICRLAARFPTKDDAHYDLRREYLPHAMRLLNRNLGNKTAEAYQLFEKVGNSFYADRRFKEAIRCFKEVCCWRQVLYSETDGFRLASEHALASAYLNDRRIKDSIEMLEHVVAIRKEILDKKNHFRLASEHELARAYLSDRRIKDAIKIAEHMVAVRKETLDEKDHDRLASEQVLASAYLNNRQIKGAIDILEHVVAVRKETLDEKDHDRLASEHALASAYLDDRRIEDAIEILEHVVAVRKETLDEKDHSRLASEHAFGIAYLYDRRVKDAIEILEHVVTVRKETLDEKDHSRLASEQVLASAYLNDRRIKDAIEMLEHVMAVQKETLDEKDPSRQLSADLLQYCFERLDAASDDDEA